MRIFRGKKVFFTNLKSIKIITKILFFMSICLISGFSQNQVPNKPEKVKFLIKAVSENEKQKGKLSFKVGEKIIIKTVLKNESSDSLPRVVTDTFYQYRFQLWKKGEKRVRPFSQDKAFDISSGENSNGPGMRMVVESVPSGKFIDLKTFDLSTIYGLLEPGLYRLTFFYRPGVLDYGKRKVASNTLILEIVP